jgi:hypothetical protein
MPSFQILDNKIILRVPDRICETAEELLKLIQTNKPASDHGRQERIGR